MATTEQTTPRELPELPIAFDRLPCEPDDDMIDVFTPTQMHAYARQAIAESEARAARDARDAARYRWLRDECDTTTGFLLAQRLEAHEWDAAIDAAQEAEREAASAATRC